MPDEHTISERAKILIRDVALRMAEQNGPFEIQISQDGNVSFVFSLEDERGKFTCQYEACAVTERLLELFDRINDPSLTSELTNDQRQAQTENGAGVTLWILLGFLRPRIAEALDDLFIESLIHAQRVIGEAQLVATEEQKKNFSSNDEVANNFLKLFARKQAEAVKKRIGARGRGAQRSFDIANVRRIAMVLKDEANQGSVAFRLGLSSRALRDLIKAEGFSNWKDFMSSLNVNTHRSQSEVKMTD